MEVIENLWKSIGKRHEIVIWDNGEEGWLSDRHPGSLWPKKPNEIEIHFGPGYNLREIRLASQWNIAWEWSITEFVMICNDDVAFQKGWVDVAKQLFQEKNHEIVGKGYGCFILRKDLNVKFDERFIGLYFEDLDHLLTLEENDVSHSIALDESVFSKSLPLAEYFCHQHYEQGWERPMPMEKREYNRRLNYTRFREKWGGKGNHKADQAIHDWAFLCENA